MDKVKFIKVNTADRLPEETGKYDTEYGYVDFNEENGLFYDHITGFVSKPDFFFEPVPDREEEMREMLEECRVQLEFLNEQQERGTTNSVLSRLKTLLES